MKRGIIASILGTVAVAGFSLVAYAEVKDNPYQVIVERNPFGLRPIPPPAPPPTSDTTPPTPPPDIKLTGITTLLGAPRAMLQVEDKTAKDPSKKFSFPVIAEGDSDGITGIAVVSIDVDNMRVRIKNGEAETTLDFKNNGIKPGAGAVSSTAPVPHPGVVSPLAPPGVIQPAALGAQAANNNNGIVGRSAVVSGGYQPTATPGTVPNLGGALPQRQMRTDSGLIMAGGGNQVYNPNPQQPVAGQPSMSREEAEARIEAARRMLQERQAAGQAVPHSPNILPPTELGRAAGAFPAPTAK